MIELLANPNLIYIFLIIGGLGIVVEFSYPGLLFPGVIGALALLLAFVGMGQMPVNWIGTALIISAVILLIVELQVPGIGIFGLGSVVCLLVGSLLIFSGYLDTADIPDSNASISIWLILGATGSVSFTLAVYYWVFAPTGTSTGSYTKSYKYPEGQLAEVTSELNPIGTVRIDNADWTATTDLRSAIHEGEMVRILEVYGGLLKVNRKEQTVKIKNWKGKGKFFRRRL